MTQTIEDVLFKAGEELFDTEQPLTTAYFILEGAVDLHLTIGSRSMELRIGENHFVGDAGVAVGRKADAETVTYRARAIAAAPVRAVPIPVEDIRAELEACPPLLKAWIASFTSRVLLLIEELTGDETGGVR
jgi:CRP-like cAMP-binding protein